MAEIPLLRESSAFARRLIDVARRFDDSRYWFHRRVNWSYRYAVAFYASEATSFSADSVGYLEQRLPEPVSLEDVFSQQLSSRQLLQAILKVLAHWLFHLLGRTMNARVRRRGVQIYRKGYVDDIELVFDPAQEGVVRGIHPFPLSIGRQVRYLRLLRRQGKLFKLDGNPYLLRDVWSLLVQRDVHALVRLEARAQLIHARDIAKLGVSTVQLSDEFDIGSLDFCRMMARYPVKVVNSAHGVGKYFPAHAYQVFHVLTLRQQQYYLATRPCDYRLRKLNDKQPLQANQQVSTIPAARIKFVFLSQVFAGISEIVASNEAVLVTRLVDRFSETDELDLLYRSHPNSEASQAPAGFRALASLDKVNGQLGTVYGSFFSTCQIDPTFKGCKVLIRGSRIHPEISFDEDQTILDVQGLIAFLEDRVRGGGMLTELNSGPQTV